MDHFRQLCEKLIYLFGLFGDRHTSVATLRTIFKASSAKKWYSETSKKIRCPKRILYIYIYVHYILYMYMIHNVSIYLYVSIYKSIWLLQMYMKMNIICIYGQMMILSLGIRTTWTTLSWTTEKSSHSPGVFTHFPMCFPSFDA